MKKFLLTILMLIAVVPLWAQTLADGVITDGHQYARDENSGLICENKWIIDRNHNNDTFLGLPFVAEYANYARTAVIDPTRSKIYIGYSKNNDAHLVIFDLMTGAYEKELPLTCDGVGISGLLCANQVGIDDAGNVWICGMYSNINTNPAQIYVVEDFETGACKNVGEWKLPDEESYATGRTDYWAVVGDITGKTSNAVCMAATYSPTYENSYVYRWELAQGATEWKANQDTFEGNVAKELINTYPESALLASGCNTIDILPESGHKASKFYIDGMNTNPTLYNLSLEIEQSFAFAPDLANKTSCNGIKEFILGGQNYLVYPEDDFKSDPGCRLNICQLGKGGSFEGMRNLWSVPKSGLGKQSDGGVRIHNISTHKVVDENGKEGVYVLSYRTNNGLALYYITEGVAKTTFTTTQNGVTYENIEGTKNVKVIGNNGSLSGVVEIPASVDFDSESYTVIEISAGAFKGCSDITGVIIPESITSIGDGAFNYTSISKITLLGSTPPEVNGDFIDNKDVQIVVPEGSLDLYKQHAYWGQFSNISDGTTNPEEEPKDPENPDDTENIGSQFIVDGLTYEVIANNKVKIISNDGSLSGVVEIPASVDFDSESYTVIEISAGAFKGCSDITGVIIPESITSIGDGAFKYTSISKITLLGSTPPEVNGNFIVNKDVQIVVPEGSLDLYKQHAYWGQFSNISDGTTNPEEEPKDPENPDDTENIGSQFTVDGLTYEVIANNKVKIISNDGSLSGYIAIKEFITDENSNSYLVAEIGSDAFAYCHYLTTLDIHENIEQFENGYLYGNEQNLEIIMRSTNPPAFADPYEGFLKDHWVLKIPMDAYSQYQERGWTGELQVIDINDPLPEGWEHGYPGEEPSDNSGILYEIIEGTQNVRVTGFEDNGNSDYRELTIPSSVFIDGKNYIVTEIGNNATIPFGVTNVILPETITYIGEKFVSGSTGSLNKITLGAKNPPMISGNIVGSFDIYYEGLWIVVPDDCVEAYKNNEYWSNFKRIVNQNDLPKYTITTSYENGTGVVTGYEGDLSGKLILPIYMDFAGYLQLITHINPEVFADCVNITSVEIPNTYNFIGTNVFKGCTGLTEVNITDLSAWCNMVFESNQWGPVPNCFENPLYYAHKLTLNGKEVVDLVIPDGVTRINRCSFINCTNIKSVTIPKSVNRIEGYAFRGCTNLTDVNISDLSAWCNTYCESSVYDIIIEGHPFLSNPNTKLRLNGEEIVDLVIPNNVTSINNGAFSCISSLKSVVISDSVTVVNPYAFGNCSNLSELTIGSSVTTLGVKCFNGCNSLEVINANPTTPPTIGWGNEYEDSVFTDYSAIVIVPLGCIDVYKQSSEWNRFSNIQGPGFSENGIKYELISETEVKIISVDKSLSGGVIIPDIANNSYKVVEIADRAFADCSAITSLVIPDSLSVIGSGVFEGCSTLETVTWNAINCSYSGNTAILPSTVKQVIFGNKIEYITSYLCAGLNTIESFDLPSSLVIIDGAAFSGCVELKAITIPESLTTIGSGVFEGCSALETVTWNAINCSYLGDTAILPSTVKQVIFGNKVEYITGYLCAGLNTIESFDLPSSLISIEGSAFKGCEGLRAITFPESLTAIRSNAFAGCSSLQAVEIPENITSLTASAFNDCTSLTDVIFNARNINTNYRQSPFPTSVSKIEFRDNVESIPQALSFNLINLTEVKIPNSVKAIEARAFSGCTYLQKVVIGTGLTSIDTQAFAGCNRIEEVVVKATTAPEIINSNAFTDDAYNFAELRVKYGYKDYYAKQLYWRNFENITEESSPNHFEVEQTGMQASRGGKFSIPLNLVNDNEIAGFQADIYLPTGFDVATNNEEYEISLTGRASASHSISYNVMSDGALRVIAYSTDAKAFEGNEGTVVNININVAENFNGLSAVEIKNVVMTAPDMTEYKCSDVKFGVSIKERALGNANGEGDVNITDVIVTANYVVGNSNTPIDLSNADINSDGTVNVIDVVGISNLIVGTSVATYNFDANRPKAINAHSLSANNFFIEDFEINPSEEKEVTIKLTNDVAFTAFQADMYLPAGLSVKGNFTLSDRKVNHSLVSSRQADGALRILSYSATSRDFNDNDGALVKFIVAADNTFNGDVLNIKNVIFSQRDMKGYTLNDTKTNVSTSGVESVLNDATYTISVINGEIIINGADDAKIVVYNINGGLIYQGENRPVSVANKGVYIVVVNGKAQKLMI